MKWLHVVAFALLGVWGCEKEEPCNKTRNSMELPVSFEVRKDKEVLGVVTVSAEKTLSLEVDSNATPSLVSTLQNVIDQLSQSDTVSFSYSDHIGDTHYSCGGEVARDTPIYADGVRMHLYSTHYYEVATQGQ